MDYIAYYRVSTQQQGRSGLGIEAQQQTVRKFLKEGDQLIEQYTEVESGKRNNRPQLEKAISQVQSTGSTLLIAKLDRLSRNAGFIFMLRDTGIPFIAADMPDANHLTVGLMAVLADHERQLISERTRAALQALKAREKNWGRRIILLILSGRGEEKRCSKRPITMPTTGGLVCYPFLYISKATVMPVSPGS